MPQVPGEIVVARAARLRQEGRVRLEAFLRTEVGSVRTVLMERGGTGRTPQFAEVAVNAAPDAGAIMDVRIIGQDGTRLVGECVAAIGAPTRQRLGTQGIKVTV
jgi:threonylcarbamoyladenosine tRNA methylthiotransferase MtaB